MPESTTEHETEPTTLDQGGVDLDTAADATAETPGTTDAAAAPEDTVESGPKRKRGRRARRAAAAARADEDRDAQAPTEDASADPAGEATEASAGAAAVDLDKGGRPGRSRKSKADKPADARGKTDQRPRGGKPGKADKRRRAKTAAGAAAASKPARTRTFGLGQVIIAMSVIAVLLGVLLLLQLIKGPGNTNQLEAQQDRGDSARQAADSVIPKLYSYDYRQIDSDTAQQVTLTTGTISDEIRNQTAPALKQLAPKTKAIVQAVSAGSAVLDASGPDVQVLVFLNQAVSSNLLPAPRLDRNRVVATMRLVDGQWKVADIKAL